jgi:hypothetical protein
MADHIHAPAFSLGEQTRKIGELPDAVLENDNYAISIARNLSNQQETLMTTETLIEAEKAQLLTISWRI